MKMYFVTLNHPKNPAYNRYLGLAYGELTIVHNRDDVHPYITEDGAEKALADAAKRGLAPMDKMSVDDDNFG